MEVSSFISSSSMAKDYIKLFVFLLKAAVFIAVIDYSLGALFESLHKRMKGGERARAYYAIEESKADIYVFGSSRALYHYDPKILQDSLGVSVYNAGRSAQTVLYHLPVLKMILERHTPRLVILDLNENEFVLSQEKYDILSGLMPYYNSHPGAKEMIDHVKPHYKYFSWSRILPYNSSVVSLLARAVRPEGKARDFNGYISVNGNLREDIELVTNCPDNLLLDTLIVNTTRELINICRSHNISLLAVTSPQFAKYSCQRKDHKAIEDLLAENNVTYLNWSNREKYIGNREFMYDRTHLNRQGSSHFTSEIASFILKNKILSTDH
jgi:hypothetical protein